MPPSGLEPTGIILVDKPAGPSSFRIVDEVRRRTGARTGHAGTLDPFATGLKTAAAAQAKALGKLASLSQSHQPMLDDAITFRLADGGSVTFAMMRRDDKITVKPKAKELVLPAEYAKLVGAKKVKKSLALQSLEPVVLVVPRTGEARVIGASDLLVSGKGR